MQRWNIAITGFGTVGRAVAELLWQRRSQYAERYGADVRLTAVCTSRAGLYASEGLAGPYAPARQDLQAGLTGIEFIESTNASVVIDAGPTDFVTGGPAYQYMRSALAHDRHAIAISKGALIFDLKGLRVLAGQHNVALKFSGATAASLPTLDLLEHNLAGCRVLKVEGILTATTNFVLNRMMQGHDLADCVAEAQRLGMAEPDPRFDMEGWDTTCKIMLLANAALGADLTFDDIEREGIDNITRGDIESWKAAGVVPKLVGEIVVSERGVTAGVRLRTYAQDHPFAHIDAKMKAIRVETDAMGEVVAICKAGPLATAASALKDFEHILMQR
ncbi:MAG: homoserine dehydrogenase [Alteromonadaceae bacterium]|nr:homoserine dehydrogenase [Alteromonadaceae bacterium]MBH86212.1 homoserine dehydrogenase [Alteromonadaceae bacterium]|tara:strand:- start:16041 stop:17036 length:996 start_codon:yes stop_codon:yes gene_type:complete